MRRLKVLLEVHPILVGGMERFLQNLLANLDRDRFEPVLFSGRDGPALRVFRERGLRWEVVDSAKDPRRMARLLREARIDLLQTNCLSFGPALAARAARVPHVWRVNGHLDLALQGGKIGIALQAILRLSRKVVCPSKFLRSQFEKTPEAGRVCVIYNGVDLARIDSEAKPQPPGADAGPPRIGMIARVQPQKRQLDFIRAARRIADGFPAARFWIFGGPNPEKESRDYARLLRREVARLGLEDKFSFKKCLKRRFAQYRRMSAFVLPSVQEGASNALLEAMALGKPVVAASSGGNAEFVEEGRTGFLVPAAKPRAIADAVMRILADPRLAERLGRQGRRRVEERFDIARSVRSYESLWLAAARRGA